MLVIFDNTNSGHNTVDPHLNSLGSQISILNGGRLHFYLMHLKIAMNIINLGVPTCEGLD